MENQNQTICVSHSKIAEVEMVTGHLPFKCQVPDVAARRTSLHKKDMSWMMNFEANGFMRA